MDQGSLPLTIVTWKWHSRNSWRQPYEAEHVNTLAVMLKQFLQVPHKLVCVTDDPRGLRCETVPLWDQPDTRIDEYGPDCYRRLYAFSPDVEKYFGPRFCSIDLDLLIMRDITSILDREDEFIILNGKSAPYNGSMWMMDTGCRSQVWEEFHPIESPAAAAQARTDQGRRFAGSDQAWISYKIPGETTWSEEDGIYQFVRDIKRFKKVPEDAKIIFFAGLTKPWESRLNQFTPELYEMYNDFKEMSNAV